MANGNLTTSNSTAEPMSEVQLLAEFLGPKRAQGLPETILLTVIYCIILVSGIIGNVCTCIVICKNQYMRTATNYYLFSLAISDVFTLILALFLYPEEVLGMEQETQEGGQELSLQISDVRSEANTSMGSIETGLTYDEAALGTVQHEDADVQNVNLESIDEEPEEPEPQPSTSGTQHVCAHVTSDKRQDKLGGHRNKLMHFLTQLAFVAENDYVLMEKGGRPSETTANFAFDLMEAGDDIIKAGQCLVDKSKKILDKYDEACAAWEDQVMAAKIKQEKEDEEIAEVAAEAAGIKRRLPQLKVVLPKLQASVQAVKEKAAPVQVNKGLHICYLCNKTFKEKRRLDDHSREHTGELLDCEICHQKFKVEQRYKEHMRDHNEGPYTCPHCGEIIKRKSTFLNHVKQVHNEDPMVCDNTKCGRTFTRKQPYEDHILHAHLPTKTCPCDLCGKLCQTFAAVRTHKSVSCPEREAHRQEKRKAKEAAATQSKSGTT